MQLLDSKGNDFYIHIDKKAKNVDLEEIKAFCKESEVYFVKRHKVFWGDSSMVRAELELLEAAVKKSYGYYHLLSGADLPIKSKAQILSFFEKNAGKEFVHFGTEQYQKDILTRYDQYHFFVRWLGRKRDKRLWCDLETYSLAVQRRLGCHRKKDILYAGGAEWFSITHEFAKYVIKVFPRYKNMCCFTQAADEWIVQTILINSPFYENLYQTGFDDDYRACMRYIDWNRGNPYVFREDDEKELLNSPCMFARKFDEKIDCEIIEKIYHALRECVHSQP